VQREFGITLDVCATAENTKCARYFTPADDGLAQDWGQAVCWMNPPFSQVKVWLRKALDSAQAGATVVCLVKHTPGVGWWRQLIAPDADVRALGRVRFVGATHQSPFDVALVIFRPPS
jgi:phage N-6-adenine-methyltransferase